MKRLAVESSHIRSIGHEGQVLEVQYKTGEIWQYMPVSEQLHRDLMAAESKGVFLNQFIKKSKTAKKKTLSNESLQIAERIAKVVDETSATLKGPRFMFQEFINEIAKIIDDELDVERERREHPKRMSDITRSVDKVTEGLKTGVISREQLSKSKGKEK